MVRKARKKCWLLKLNTVRGNRERRGTCRFNCSSLKGETDIVLSAIE